MQSSGVILCYWWFVVWYKDYMDSVWFSFFGEKKTEGLLDVVRFRVLKVNPGKKKKNCSVLIALDLQAGCMSVTSVRPFHGTPLWWPTSITHCQGEAIEKSLRYLDDIPNLKTTNWPLEDCSCSQYSSVYYITVIFVLWVEFGVSTWFVSASRKTIWLILR